MAEFVDTRPNRIHHMRALARRLRPEQHGREWEELRDAVDALVCRLIDRDPTTYKLTDDRHGIASAILAPLTDSVAALRYQGAVFVLECVGDWTPLGEAKIWLKPCRPTITMVGVERPPGPLH